MTASTKRHLRQQIDDYLSDAYPAWRDYLPLELGIHKHLEPLTESQGFDEKLLQNVITHHVERTQYLENTLKHDHRHNLQGERTEPLTDVAKGIAEVKLNNRESIRQQKAKIKAERQVKQEAEREAKKQAQLKARKQKRKPTKKKADTNAVTKEPEAAHTKPVKKQPKIRISRAARKRLE